MDENVNRIDQGLKLKEAFVQGSYEDKDKQAQLKAQGKNAWLRERIIVKILDEKGHEMNGCTFLISRRTLSRQTLQLRVNACPRPCIIDYVYDNTGAALAIEDMMEQAIGPPAFYVIVPERLLEPYDVLHHTNYEGSTGVFIHFVPQFCDNHSAEVDETTLREWVLFAVMEGDHSLKPFYDEIERSRMHIKEIQREIKSAESKVFYDANNNKIEGDWAEKERNLLYNLLAGERAAEEKMLEVHQQNLERHRASRQTRIGITLERQPLQSNKMEVCTWRLFIHGVPDAVEIENALIEKKDWSGIRLASYSDARGLAPWVGRRVVPVGVSSLHPDYTGLEVKMAAARVMRVPHGVGLFKTLNRSSSSIAAEKYGIFYGEWHEGKKSGNGFEIDDAGVYTGNFEKGFRRGNGRLDLGDGTSVLGTFDVTQLRPSAPLGGFENPYLDGEPHGHAEILFGDGGWYRGEMRDGIIDGLGEYQSGFGDVLKGNFNRGVLEGPDGSIQSHTGEKLDGTFEMGELHGFGKYSNRRGDSYEGEFQLGFRHGRGSALYNKSGEYKGFHTWGMRSGKGEFNYELKRSSAEQSTPDVLQRFRYAFNGYLFADRIASGGLVMDTDVKVPRSISQRVDHTAKPMEAISKQINRQAQRIRRDREKMTFLETKVREEVSAKKHKIFRQQRHLTKKSMYQDDVLGESELSIEARHKNRQDRLDFMSYGPPRILLPGATIDRLRERTQQYQEVLDAIQPSEMVIEATNLSNSLQLMRMAVSDIEEMAERHRFLKYDRIWARAEAAFIGLKSDGL